MKYIRIKNTGEIEPQALHLVGGSTKRNDTTKIGQFGSGNKYALAYFLRSGYEVKIFAGEKEITIETKPETFRETEFNVIHINGERTSITTEMGKDWQFWQAIREVYCNAIDEGGYDMDFVNTITPVAGETHFYIDSKKDVTEFFTNFDNYFATKKKVLFECPTGRILEKSGTEVNIYRKGIRCFNSNKTSMYDYDFNNISIDENRLVSYHWQIDEAIWSLIFQCDNEEVIKAVLFNTGKMDMIEATISDYSTIHSSNMSETFRKVIQGMKIAPMGMAGLLKPDEAESHSLVPTKVFRSVRGVLGENNIGSKFRIAAGAMYRIIPPTSLQNITLKKALEFLEECGFPIHYDMRIALFDDKEIMGCADDGMIIISDLCLSKGINEVVNTIIEEFIHLKYNARDETRGFQTGLITEFIEYMKRQNSYCI